MNRIAIALLSAGLFAWAVAFLWWWLTYRDVITYAYVSAADAGLCLVGDNDICRLARALCRGDHPLDIIDYRAATFWIGLAALSASLTMSARRAG